MASHAKMATPAANGVITGPPKGVVGGNRKKQKRRAKQAAKAASEAQGAAPSGRHVDEEDYEEDALGYGEEDDYDYSDTEQYHDQYIPPHAGSNGYSMPPPPAANGKKKGKKKRGSEALHYASHNPELLANHVPPLPNPPPPPTAMTSRMLAKGGRDAIWNTSSQQERQNIKDFWLSLSEDERKSLLKIEKEAVLRKMKQQQKHSCSCTVCGRKRTAIEEELEVLYEGYYEELEQYAHHDHPPLPSTDGMMPDPLQHRRLPHPLAAPPPPAPPQMHPAHHRTSQLQEHFEEEDYSDEEDEEYSDEEDDYSDDEIEQIPRTSGVQDFFNFGQNLTVKDNLLTVADDLLKNDGRKFIEMMEQLAERRMARESEAEYAAANPSHPGGGYGPNDPPYNHEDPLAAGEDYDDDEASYDSQEDYDDDLEDEDEMGGLTEEQRMQEGRRMFQIFAARMFEQRVLTAYKEKVAAERQQKLLEELDNETKLEAEREAKKLRDAQKKKDKKKQQQAAKAEEKAKRDAEKASEEARIKEAEEKKAEEQRRRKEDQRRKKEEERRKQDEDRARKEAEKARRLQEEQQRREEAERKARDQRAAEKARKDEARKREREEREAREKEARERKAAEEKEKKEREAKAKAEKEAKEREKTAQQAAQPPAQHPPPPLKRPSQAGMVAVPGLHAKQTTSGISSPHPTVATPAMPKAPTPAKQRQASQQGSHASSPKQTQSQVSSVPSKSSSPNSAGVAQQQQPQTVLPKTIMQKPTNQHPQGPQQPPMQVNSPPHQQQIQPPPGMPHPQHPGSYGGMNHMGFHGFQGHHGPMMHGNIGQRGPMPMFPHQGPPHMAGPNRFGPPGSMPGMPPPPGMSMPPYGRGMGPPFDPSGGAPAPPGFGQMHIPQTHHTPPIGPSPAPGHSGGDAQRASMPSHSHSRQQSIDRERFEAPANHPVSRPAPIGRPGSVKPEGKSADVEELSKHLGSSALLDDSDEPMPTNAGENRRTSGIPTGRPNHPGSIGPIGSFGAPGSGFGAPGSSWPTPSLPFGQGSGLGQQNWGGLSTPGIGSWQQNNAAFAANGFGTIGSAQIHRPAGGNRPQTIRIAVCQACKHLTGASRGEGDGFHPVEVLVRQIRASTSHPMLADVPPTVDEIEDICDTEGDSNNGGGELDVRRQPGEKSFAVKWSPDAATPDGGRGFGGLGEIGSPMPQKSSPSGGYVGAPGAGRGFGSIGAIGSHGF